MGVIRGSSSAWSGGEAEQTNEQKGEETLSEAHTRV
jgi:hypothetical protein